MRALAWFAGAGVLTAYVGRVAFYATVERLGAMRASTLQRLNPFFAVVMGVRNGYCQIPAVASVRPTI